MKVSILDKLGSGFQLDAYHDGKASPSRLVRVVVDHAVSRVNLPAKYIRLWKRELKEDFESTINGCVVYIDNKGLDATTQFWDWNCNEFIIGHIVGDKRTEKDPMLFAKRTGDLGWYGVNWNYSLDPTGRIRRENQKRWKTCAKERGLKMEWNSKEGRYDYFDLKSGKKVED